MYPLRYLTKGLTGPVHPTSKYNYKKIQNKFAGKITQEPITKEKVDQERTNESHLVEL